MFKSKSHGDIKKSSQKVLDYKKDILARLKHLKIVIETLETHDLKTFFETNFSQIYYIFYEVFVQIEIERRQKGYRLHKDDFEFLLLLLEKILILLPGLIQRRWQFHSIGRIMKKLLHSGNSIKVRREGVRLFLMWYQILQENNSTENHAIFSRLAQITATDYHYFAFSDHCQVTIEKPVCVSEIGAVQPPSSAEKAPEKLCVYFLELVLTFVVSEVAKIEWNNPAQKQACFIFLFESIKKYYMPVIFPAFEQRSTIYGGGSGHGADHVADSLADGAVDHGDPASPSQLEDCRDVVVRWFTNFVQMSRLQHGEDASAAVQTDRTSAVGATEETKDGSLVATPAFSLGPSGTSTNVGGTIDRSGDESVTVGSLAVDGSAARLAASQPAIPSAAAASQNNSVSEGSDGNDTSSSEDGAESLHDSELQDFSQHEIVRSVLFGTRQNVDIIHEVFRQAFMLPIRLAGGIRRVVAVYKEWLQMPVYRPIFLQDPVLLSVVGGGSQGGSASGTNLTVGLIERDLAEARASRQRPHSYIAAVKWESGGGSSIGRDGLSIRAGLRNSVLLFIQHSSCVFEKEAAGEPLSVQVRLCLQVLNLYRYIVMKLNLDQQTWEQLLRVLLKISATLLGEGSRNIELAKELAAPVLQTLIVTWIKANLYVYISTELWNSILDTLSALTHWRELISEWAKTMETLTRILAKHVYKLDLSDLPLDRMKELKSRRLRSLVPLVKEKKTATFSRAYTGLDNSGTAATLAAPRAPGKAPAAPASFIALSAGAAAAPALTAVSGSNQSTDNSACTDEEDEFDTLAHTRLKPSVDAAMGPPGSDGSSKQLSSQSTSLLKLARSNSDGNLADSLDRRRGTNAGGSAEPAAERSSMSPSRSTPPRSVSAAGSGASSPGRAFAPGGGGSGSRISAVQQQQPPPLPDRPGPPPPLIPPPPLPPPPRVTKRHGQELGRDPSPGIDTQPPLRRSKEAAASSRQGGSSSGEPSPATARRRASPARSATLGAELRTSSSGGGFSSSLNRDPLAAAAVAAEAAASGGSAASVRSTFPVGQREPNVDIQPTRSLEASSTATAVAASTNDSIHSRHLSDREDSLIQMDFTTPWLNQDANLEDGYAASSHENWSAFAGSDTTATVSASAPAELEQDLVPSATTGALAPDEEVSMASTDDYRPPAYDPLVDTELAAVSSTASMVAGHEGSICDRSELQTLLGAAVSAQSVSSSSPPSPTSSSGQPFNYSHTVNDRNAIPGCVAGSSSVGGVDDSGSSDSSSCQGEGGVRASEVSQLITVPPLSPRSHRAAAAASEFVESELSSSSRLNADGEGDCAAEPGTPDGETLRLDDSLPDDMPGAAQIAALEVGDRRSVVLGGQQRGWTPTTSVVLWRRMLGILGNPNSLSHSTSHAAVFNYLRELLTVILKIADNQGVVIGNQQVTQPPPEVAAPVLFLAPACFKAQELSDEYKAGKLTALQMLCMMTLRHVYTPPSEGHLIQFYLTAHTALTSSDQDVVNVLVKNLSPYLFGLDLPGSTMLIMDVINAAGSVISLASLKVVDAPIKEGVTLLGSLVCFPNHFGETPVLYENQPGLCPMPSKHMKECLMELLKLTVTMDSVIMAARCVALGSLGVFLVEELLAGTFHESIDSAVSVLLQNLKRNVPAAASHVACDVLSILSEHVGALGRVKAELPTRILTDLVQLLSEQIAASPESDENLIVSLMFCILHWCMALDVKELLTAPVTPRSGAASVSEDSLLRRVFAVLCPSAAKTDLRGQQQHNSSSTQEDSSGGSDVVDVSGDDVPQSPFAGADAGDREGDRTGFASQQRSSGLGETELVQAAAKYVVCHLVNHLSNYPVESETLPLVSTVHEQHDLVLPCSGDGTEAEKVVVAEDLSSAVFSSPALQVFVYNGSTLISCVEIEKRDIDIENRFVSTSVTTRILVRDITGKYCWNAALMYGQPKILPVHDLGSSTLRLSSFSSPADREPLDSIDVDGNFSQTADELAQVLQSIAEVTPECQLIPGQALDLPSPPVDDAAAHLEDDIVKHLLRQQSDDNQYYAEHKGDFRMTAGIVEAPAYQEPLAPFLQSRQYLHHFGFLSWENRQKVDLLQKSDRLLRELKNLDNQLRSRETHKIAVIYVAEGQEDKRAVLGNSAGSEAFERFVAGLGWEVDLGTHKGFMGGLQRDGKTGTTAPYYATSSVEVLYHVSTRMPGATDDDQHRKLKHLGNDEVHIVWSEHYREFRRGIISTEFGDALIIIYPLQNGLCRVRIDKKPEVPHFGPLFDGAIVSRRALPSLVRATAISASRQHRLTLPHFHPFFVQRARSIDKIASECRKPTTFETFAASVFSPGLVLPSPGGNDTWDFNALATGSATADDVHLNHVDSAASSKKEDSSEQSVTMRAMRMLSVKRGKSLLQRRHTDFARTSPPPSPTSPRKK